jgi:hypothetical protein
VSEAQLANRMLFGSTVVGCLFVWAQSTEELQAGWLCCCTLCLAWLTMAYSRWACAADRALQACSPRGW